MPYLKDRTDPMRRLINAYELNNCRALAEVLRVSPSTAARRIQNPAELTLQELRLLASKGHIPIDEIRNAL